MVFKSTKISLLILGITAVLCSRLLFFFFNDPEGPNFLIVIGLAAVVYVISLAPFAFGSPANVPKRFLLAISVQILVVVGLYFFIH